MQKYELPPLPKELLLDESIGCRWNDCGKTFGSHRKCFQHVKADHDLKANSKCGWTVCSYTSTNINNMRNHLKRHFNIIEAACTVCENLVSFKWRSSTVNVGLIWENI